MFALSWPGVRYCMEALQRPKRQEQAVHAITAAGQIAAGGHEPVALLEVSTLVRLFHAWHQMDPRPLRTLDAETNPLRHLDLREVALLRSADALARRLGRKHSELPPKPTLLLEIVRLWDEMRNPSKDPSLFSAVDAFQIFKEIHAVSDQAPKDILEQFVRACMILYGNRLVRLSIVQYALDANRPYAPFRTTLGYIKWIHTPLPYQGDQGTRHAESVQAPRKLVSFG